MLVNYPCMLQFYPLSIPPTTPTLYTVNSEEDVPWGMHILRLQLDTRLLRLLLQM